jgi:hypothetical protein
MRPPVSQRVAAQPIDLVVGVSEPADRRRVRRIARLQHLRFACIFAGCGAFEHLHRLVRRDRIGDVMKIDARDELPGSHVGQQLPHRLPLAARVEVPDGVDDGGQREVNHALLRPEPPQLRLAGQAVPEAREVRRDAAEVAPDHEVAERIHRRGAHFVAPPDGERQAVSLEAGVGVQNDIRRRIVGVGVHRIGADLVLRGGKAEIENVQIGNCHLFLVTSRLWRSVLSFFNPRIRESANLRICESCHPRQRDLK